MWGLFYWLLGRISELDISLVVHGTPHYYVCPKYQRFRNFVQAINIIINLQPTIQYSFHRFAALSLVSFRTFSPWTTSVPAPPPADFRLHTPSDHVPLNAEDVSRTLSALWLPSWCAGRRRAHAQYVVHPHAPTRAVMGSEYSMACDARLPLFL